mmetsp:Transcript_21025/g.41056  ORF Transcript_21025/g.41056 Transcript_21025/m.41056 type:complete len:139 (-) Transcript_21025:77-493(-)
MHAIACLCGPNLLSTRLCKLQASLGNHITSVISRSGAKSAPPKCMPTKVIMQQPPSNDQSGVSKRTAKMTMTATTQPTAAPTPAPTAAAWRLRIANARGYTVHLHADFGGGTQCVTTRGRMANSGKQKQGTLACPQVH